MRIRIKNTILLLATASICLAGEPGPVKLVADPPLPAPKTGALEGQISPASQIRTLHAVSRATGKQYQPATFDKTTGRFTFTALPGEAVYDICITTNDGREIEGIDLSFVDARLERLAAARRKQLDLPPRPAGRFTRQDVQDILRFVRNWKDFTDTRRVLYVRGHGDKATVLVELMRLRDFHNAQADIVWRIELWYFARQGGGWERIANVERVLRRVRTQPGDWQKISIEYDPRLSMKIDETGKSKPLTFTIPAKPDPAKGRPADTPPKLNTKPNVSGVEEADTADEIPNSQPPKAH